jgi:hypothetical protein
MEEARRGCREADSSRKRKGIRLSLGCWSDDDLCFAGDMDCPDRPRVVQEAVSWRWF